MKNVFENILGKLYAYNDLFKIIDIFSEMLEAKDAFMPYHMTNVANIASRIGIEMELDSNNLDMLIIAASVHDIGKIFIPDRLLKKTGPLTNEERDIIKLHSEYGAELVSVVFSNMWSYKKIPDIVSKHHENFDGSGYPYMMKGERIPLISRVIRIADSIDAMSSSRPYKNKLSIHEIVEELKKYSGTYYDPNIIPYAINVLNRIENLKITDPYHENKIYSNASISLKDYNNSSINSFSGTFKIKNNIGHFKTRVASGFKRKIEKCMNHNASIILFVNEKLIELEGTIIGTVKGELFLENIIQHPIDTLFSLSWDSKCSIKKNSTQSFELRILELGASGLVLESNNKEMIDSNLLLINDVLEITFDETVDTLHLSLTVNVKVQNTFFMGNKILIKCIYLDLKPQDTDMILKVLFRKQTVLRRSLFKG